MSDSTLSDLGRLYRLLQRDPDERTALCTKAVDGPFRASWCTIAEASVAALPQDMDCWYTTQHMGPEAEARPGGRGLARHVVAVRELTCDLDYKPDGARDEETARAIVDDLADMTGVAPVALVPSGHGLQPHWRVADDGVKRTNVDLVALYRRWGRLVAMAAEKHHAGVDSVYDVSRVMRCPGTRNVGKGAAVPTSLLVGDPGDSITLGRLEECLADYGVGELAMDRDMDDDTEVQAPPQDWVFGEFTVQGVELMVKCWADERPGVTNRAKKTGVAKPGRNPWLYASFHRLHAAHRLAAITEADYTKARKVLLNRFAELLAGAGGDEPRRAQPGEIAGADQRAMNRISRKTIEECGQEIGGVPVVGNLFARNYVPAQRGAAAADVTVGPVGDAGGTGDPAPGSIPDEFWECEGWPVLAHIRRAARAGLVSPEAALALAITEVLAHTMPWVGLTKIGAAEGRSNRVGVTSLNLLACVVGPSGMGKDEANGVVQEALRIDSPRKPETDTVGSGEGIGGAFVGLLKPDPEMAPSRTELGQRNWLFKAEVSESDTLAALAGRAGNTLLPEVRKAAMGQRLGFKNADKKRNFPVEPGTYRFVANVFAQPTKLGWLFDDDEGGTPQRFLYAFAGDLAVPADLPDWPGEFKVAIPAEMLPGVMDQAIRFPPGLARGSIALEVCPETDRLTEAHRRDALVMAQQDTEAHSHLTRRKVAAALWLLNSGRGEVCEAWELSGHVMAHSRAVSGWVESQLAERAARKGRQRGAAIGHEQAAARAVFDGVTAEQVSDLADRLHVALVDAGETGMTTRQLRDTVSTKQRGYFTDALAELEEEPGRARCAKVTSGSRWFAC